MFSCDVLQAKDRLWYSSEDETLWNWQVKTKDGLEILYNELAVRLRSGRH